MRGEHGSVGASLFLVAYVVAMIFALTRIETPPPPAVFWMVVVLVIITPVVTMRSIRLHGGAAAGEGLGCLGAILVASGMWAAPAIGSILSPGTADAAVWRVVGGSLPPLLMAATLQVTRFNRP